MKLNKEQKRQLELARQMFDINQKKVKRYVKLYIETFNLDDEVKGYERIIEAYKQITERLKQDKHNLISDVRNIFYKELVIEDKCDEMWYGVLFNLFNIDMR